MTNVEEGKRSVSLFYIRVPSAGKSARMCEYNLQDMCSALLLFLPSSCCIIRQAKFEILNKCELASLYTFSFSFFVKVKKIIQCIAVTSH